VLEPTSLYYIISHITPCISYSTNSARRILTTNQHIISLFPPRLTNDVTENPLFQDDDVIPSKKTIPWTSDPDLHDGVIEQISTEETVFWEELIKSYLFPMEGDKKEQEKTQEGLIELR